MHLRSDRETRSRRRALDGLDDEFRRPDEISAVDYFLRTLRMHEHRRRVPARTNRLDMLLSEQSVNAAMPLPENHACIPSLFGRQTSIGHSRIPQSSLCTTTGRRCINLRDYPARVRRVPSQVLVRQKQDLRAFARAERFIATCKRPVENLASIRTGAARAPMLPDQRLDRSA